MRRFCWSDALRNACCRSKRGKLGKKIRSAGGEFRPEPSIGIQLRPHPTIYVASCSRCIRNDAVATTECGTRVARVARRRIVCNPRLSSVGSTLSQTLSLNFCLFPSRETLPTGLRGSQLSFNGWWMLLRGGNAPGCKTW
jgi:hypothetical protein